jgi:lipid-binding SYLF domain-containing protein
MKRIRLNVMLLAAAAMLMSACSTAPKTETERQNLQDEANATLEQFRASDLTIKDQISKAYGYAVFPTVGKGGVGVGGAYGRGIVYEQGRPVGYCDLSQGSIGLQLGGQKYSELILFENKASLDRFKRGEFELAAQASAVAAASGAGANAKYDHGVIVYTLGEKGAMFEASVGGQKFDYQPM